MEPGAPVAPVGPAGPGVPAFSSCARTLEARRSLEIVPFLMSLDVIVPSLIVAPVISDVAVALPVQAMTTAPMPRTTPGVRRLRIMLSPCLNCEPPVARQFVEAERRKLMLKT